MIYSLEIKSKQKEEIIDITEKVNQILKENKVKDGIVCVFIPHTTAGITINENADPSVRTDIILGLKSLGLERNTYNHIEGNSPSHIKASLMGFSVIVFVDNDKLVLGTWQGIYFCEFDGPRNRKALVKII